ncbi:DnaJ like chaperone protein [Tenacibaculum sp. MAR_2009_124]|uniref:TerB family tellurite resistance protein n=1 Tax=Tenacibaculum sp. MAR_2009_124 TaxID=1250059 RepID=UPI0008965D1A|nr:TerB family tellurite resistance protein [Tenacibaculum sp. MAR_2009_124]SEC16714.1 DnaJ like chaperone protein [Tenacibaculum sp. MAR_2009_124]
MGKFAKWLGAGAGFTLGGPIGAVIGFVVGSFIDGVSLEDLKEEEKEYKSQRKKKSYVESGDFEISLLILASIVIKADGHVDKRELDYVREYFVNLYGKERANNAFKLFKGIVNRKVSSRQVCMQIRQYMSHASRLQLIHFLFGIAKSDGSIKLKEEAVIAKIAHYLYISERDFNSIKAMFVAKSKNAYEILEISKNANDTEVKKAYRKMVKKYHPDKLIGLGEEHIQGGKQKFQQIQKAYEEIRRERGI